MRKTMLTVFAFTAFSFMGRSVSAQDHNNDPSMPDSAPVPVPTPTPAPVPKPDSGSASDDAAVPKPGSGKTAPVKKERGPVEIFPVADRKVFVGDEPVTITYHLLIKAGVICNTDGLVRLKTEPFSILSVSVGSRVALREVKDTDLMKISVLVRLDQGEYGKYNLPALQVPYSYDKVVEDSGGGVKKIRRKGTATSTAVEIEKVPLYVETDTLHEVSAIGQKNTQSVLIHADNKTDILNEYMPEKAQEGVTYLSSFAFQKPLILLGTLRQELNSAQYRVVSYRYEFLVGDIGPASFAAPFPHVLWRMQEEQDAHVIAPSPAKVEVRSILKKDTVFEPQKGVIPDPAAEHNLFLVLPAVIAGVLAVGLAGLGLYQLLIFLDARKRKALPKAAVLEEYVPHQPEYDTSWWARMKLARNLRHAESAFVQLPDARSCSLLRSLLARKAVAKLKGKNRVDRTAVCAMTVNEIREKVGFEEAAIVGRIEALDHRLETADFGPRQG